MSVITQPVALPNWLPAATFDAGLIMDRFDNLYRKWIRLPASRYALRSAGLRTTRRPRTPTKQDQYMRTICPEDMNSLFFSPKFLKKVEASKKPSAQVYLDATDEEVSQWLKEGREIEKKAQND